MKTFSTVYSQNASEFSQSGLITNGTLYANSLQQLKVKRNKLLTKLRRQNRITELVTFGAIKKVVESVEDFPDDTHQLTDTITNKYVSQHTKDKAGKLKRIQDRKLKLQKIQKKGKFKSHQRFH